MKRLKPILGILLICAPFVAVAQPMPIDTVNVSVEEGIRLVLNREIPHGYGTALILRAGASRNPAYIPLLKQVVDSWAPGGSSNVAHFGRNDHFRPQERHTEAAVYSLWLIGGSDDYFYENLHNWESDFMLANQSARVLALNPTPEFLRELERVCEESNNPYGSNYLWGALSLAKGVAESIQAYEALTGDAARTRMVVNKIAGRWAPYRETSPMSPSGSGWTAINYSDLKYVVNWGWFRTLSREKPALIANAIRNVDVQTHDFTNGGGRDLTPEEMERLQAWLSHLAALPLH